MVAIPEICYGITRTKLSAEFSRPKLTEMSYSAKLSSDAKNSEATADFCIGIDRRQMTEDRRQKTEDRHLTSVI